VTAERRGITASYCRPRFLPATPCAGNAVSASVLRLYTSSVPTSCVTEPARSVGSVWTSASHIACLALTPPPWRPVERYGVACASESIITRPLKTPADYVKQAVLPVPLGPYMSDGKPSKGNSKTVPMGRRRGKNSRRSLVHSHRRLCTTARRRCRLWRASPPMRTAALAIGLRKAPRKPAAWSVPFLGRFPRVLPKHAQERQDLRPGATRSVRSKLAAPQQVAMAASEESRGSPLILTSPCGLLRMSKAAGEPAAVRGRAARPCLHSVPFAHVQCRTIPAAGNCTQAGDRPGTLEAALRLLLIRQVAAGDGRQAEVKVGKTRRQQAGRVG